MLTLSSKNFKGVFQQNGSEWRVASFLEGSAPALPKIFGASGYVPSSFSARFSRLRFS
jgi:hypothetical protein